MEILSRNELILSNNYIWPKQLYYLYENCEELLDKWRNGEKLINRIILNKYLFKEIVVNFDTDLEYIDTCINNYFIDKGFIVQIVWIDRSNCEIIYVQSIC